MEIYLIIFLVFILLIIGLIVWIYRLFKLYKKGNRKSFGIQVIILGIILTYVTWNLGIFPLSKNFFIKEQSELLTGKSFWSWEEYDYEEIGIRGEGYTIDIYKFNEEIAEYFKNPTETFFNNYPMQLDYREKWERVKWKKTPVEQNDIKYLEHATPNYAGWETEIVDKMKFVRDIANKNGSLYAYNHRGLNNVDFFIISPTKRLIIMINHNM